MGVVGWLQLRADLRLIELKISPRFPKKMVVLLGTLVFNLILLTKAFIVQEKKPLEQIEVRVNYGDGMEELLVDAVRGGRGSQVHHLLIAEINSIEARVRSRGFFYMGEGVKQRGIDVGATRSIIDSVKSEMLDTVHRLEIAKLEIELLLQEISVTEPGMEETLLDILKSLRNVPSLTELKYRHAITGGFEVRVEDVTGNH